MEKLCRKYLTSKNKSQFGIDKSFTCNLFKTYIYYYYIDDTFQS